MICMKNLRFSSHPRAKVRRQGPPGFARAHAALKSQWLLVTGHRLSCENVALHDTGLPELCSDAKLHNLALSA